MPLPAAVAGSKEERLRQIESTLAARKIDEIICGYPINMDGSTGFKAKEVDVFIREIEVHFGLPVHRVDERLSSYSVEQMMKQQKKQLDRKSGELDSRAATLILQDFIEAKRLFHENSKIL